MFSYKDHSYIVSFRFSLLYDSGLSFSNYFVVYLEIMVLPLQSFKYYSLTLLLVLLSIESSQEIFMDVVRCRDRVKLSKRASANGE